jgi:N-formylmaleamate deformylase
VNTQPQWKQGDIPENIGFLHYYRTGKEGSEPVILVHGFSDNGLCWTPVARELQKSYDVIMPDMKSHGLSARIHKDETVDMAADLAGLIQGLGISRPIIIGHSMGAMIAFRAATRNPDLARALVLEDPPWFIPQPRNDHGPEESMMAWARSLPSQSIEELDRINRTEHPGWSDEMVHLMSESKKQFDPTFVDRLLSNLNRDDDEWSSAIRTTDLPLLLVTGNPKLGALVTGEVTARISALNPKVQIKNMPDVGHLIRFDKFGEYMDAVFGFLEGLQE